MNMLGAQGVPHVGVPNDLTSLLASTVLSQNSTLYSYLPPPLQFFSQNPYLSSLIILGIITAILRTLLSLAQSIYQRIWGRNFYRITVASPDEALYWCLEWLCLQPYSKVAPNADCLTELSSESVNRLLQMRDTYARQSKKKTPMYIPSRGSHTIKYKNHDIFIERGVEVIDKKLSAEVSVQTQAEKLTLLCTNKEAIVDLIQEAGDKYYANRVDKTWLYTISQSAEGWTKLGDVKNVDYESVILPSATKKMLKEDIKHFAENADWYSRCGIPYRRGYLLYGPGSGKSTFVLSVAAWLKLNVCIISFAERMDDQFLSQMMDDVPAKSLIYIKNIEYAYIQLKNQSSGLTLSGLLNALDGALSQEGRMLFLSAGDISKLGPEVLRPGRVDLRVHFDYVDSEQVEQMSLKIFPTKGKLAKELAQKLHKQEVTCAQIQDYLMRFTNNPESSLGGIDEFIAQCETERKEEQRKLKEFEAQSKQEGIEIMEQDIMDEMGYDE